MFDYTKWLGDSTILKQTSNGFKADGMGMITPINVSKDIIDLLPEEVFNKDARFLDISCKSGNLLTAIRTRLMESESMIKDFPDKVERRKYIVNNQLYGIVLNESDQLIATRLVYGCLREDTNIVYIPSYTERYIRIRDIKGLQDKLKELTGQMKFDVIIGNPPYNNDMYLDFVTVAKKLIEGGGQNSYVCMITPAKWQAKGGKKNEDFRDNIVPYMEKIVYYPDAFELFNIREQEGITYYTIDKNIHEYKDIRVASEKIDKFRTEVEHRNNVKLTLFGNSIANIITKCTGPYLNEAIGVKQSEYVKNTDSGNSTGEIKVFAGEKLCGYKYKNELFTTIGLDRWKVTTSVMPVDVGFDKNNQVFGLSKVYILAPNQVPKGSFPVLMKFETELECQSFTSYCETRLVRFLYYIGICGKTIAEEFWRFIPNQFNWDHIFTDKELYEKYKLTEEEINIIESVIKDRK